MRDFLLGEFRKRCAVELKEAYFFSSAAYLFPIRLNIVIT